jgi:hypothetical protein
MSQIKAVVSYQLSLTDKELSLVLRRLAGHELKKEEEAIAMSLNVRLLRQRQAYLTQTTQQCEMALTNAKGEYLKFLAETTGNPDVAQAMYEEELGVL